jgi:hypothetical protein
MAEHERSLHVSDGLPNKKGIPFHGTCGAQTTSGSISRIQQPRLGCCTLALPKPVSEAIFLVVERKMRSTSLSREHVEKALVVRRPHWMPGAHTGGRGHKWRYIWMSAKYPKAVRTLVVVGTGSVTCGNVTRRE